jgi:hypothetical protein
LVVRRPTKTWAAVAVPHRKPVGKARSFGAGIASTDLSELGASHEVSNEGMPTAARPAVFKKFRLPDDDIDGFLFHLFKVCLK